MDKLSTSLPQYILSITNTPTRGIHFVQEHTKESMPALLEISVVST